LVNGVQQAIGGLLSEPTDYWLDHHLIGMQSYEHNISMQGNTRFWLGSNSKVICAIAIYQLQEQSKLNVGHNIGQYLDAQDFDFMGFPNITTYCPKLGGGSADQACQNITFIDLMSMKSGMVDVVGCGEDGGSNYCETDPTGWQCIYCWQPWQLQYPGNGNLGGMLSWFINVPLSTVPNTNYLYTNTNFILLAYFVQKLSGMPYNQYVEQNIFAPLGMTNTYAAVNAQQTEIDVSCLNRLCCILSCHLHRHHLIYEVFGF
jgi:CubicO group peptidase (beta-lactamase class C family)